MAARLLLLASALLSPAMGGGGGGGGDASPGALQLSASTLTATAASTIASGGALFVRFYLNG